MKHPDKSPPSKALVVVAENLAALRAASATLNSQAAIGKKAEIDQRTVGRIMNMEHEPTLAQLSKLARAFKLDPWQLLVPQLVPSNPPLLASESAALLALLKNIGNTKEALEGYLRHDADTGPGDLPP